VLWLNLSHIWHVAEQEQRRLDPGASRSTPSEPNAKADAPPAARKMSEDEGVKLDPAAQQQNSLHQREGPVVQAADSCGAKCGSVECCWELQNSAIRAVFTSRPWPQWYAVETKGSDDGGPPVALPIHGAPLFQLISDANAKTSTTAGGADCSLVNVTMSVHLALSMELSCSHGVEATFHAFLRDTSSHYLRVSVDIRASTRMFSSSWPSGGFGVLRLLSFGGLSRVAETRDPPGATPDDDLAALDGLPLLLENHFWVAVEHPLGVMRAASGNNWTHWRDVIGQLTHLGRLPKPTQDSPWRYGACLGTFTERSQARRAFVSYLHAERPGRRTPMVHYNSWYDFYSYQDEGFNGGFKDHDKNPELIAKLRPDKLGEANCLQRVEAFGKELVEKRGTAVQSFLWDDGWDNTQSLWEFDEERFPNRFDNIATKAKSYGAGTGVWLSPWGGYGFPQENRVKYGKAHGLETNWNMNMETEAFSLAGAHYRKVFKDVALKFRREQGVNMYKFDGVAGDPRELAVEMEAMLGLLAELRAAAKPKRAKGDEDDDDIWINLTTGTWASPFFLLWADSIWRGGPDIPSRRKDWEPDVDRSLLRIPGLTWADVPSDGLSRRQRWIRWRNLVVQVLVVSRSHFFPLSQLMIHGVIVASHGDALHWGLSFFDEVDFTQEVWSFVALGLQLQELYIAPRYMTSQAWDIVAEGLQWASREASILRDSHWAFGDARLRQVYCVSSWDVAAARGFLFFHNPTGKVQNSDFFSLASALELPYAQSMLELHLKLVKSASREALQSKATRLSKLDLLTEGSSKPRSDATSTRKHRFSTSESAAPTACQVSLPPTGIHSAGSASAGGSCSLAAQQQIDIQLLASEVLVLEVAV